MDQPGGNRRLIIKWSLLSHIPGQQYNSKVGLTIVFHPRWNPEQYNICSFYADSPRWQFARKGCGCCKGRVAETTFFFSYVVCGNVLYNLKETPTLGITERWHRGNGSSHLSFRGKNHVITFHQHMRKLTFKIPASIPLHLGNHSPGIPSKSLSGKKLWLYLITHLKSLCCWKVSRGSLAWGKVDLGGTILI